MKKEKLKPLNILYKYFGKRWKDNVRKSLKVKISFKGGHK